MDFAEDLNKLTDTFPKKEIYNLSSQMMRTVDSVALNISEGSTGQPNPEFKKFTGYSIRSLAEGVTCLHKAQKRSYVTDETFTMHYEKAFDLMNMMIAFKQKWASGLLLRTPDSGPPTSDSGLRTSSPIKPHRHENK